MGLSVGEELVVSDGKLEDSFRERELSTERLLMSLSMGEELVASDDKLLGSSMER